MRRLLVAVLLCAGTALASAQDAGLEYRVKAAYLFNFTKFIEWPNAAFVGGRSFSFSICVAGRNPFGPALTATLVGETAAGLPLAARVVNAGGAAGCHVLFVPAGVPPETYLRAVGKLPVLTVGESPDFLTQGGAINFILDGGRVRFEINQAAAERAQLRISSRLLQLGRGSNPQGDE
jgi:hypothetical protein